MKKIIFSAALFFVVTSIYSQTTIAGRSVRLGFKIDPVISNTLHPNDAGIEKAGGKMGINYGLMTDFLFSDGRGAFATGVEIAHSSASLDYPAGKGLYKEAAQTYDIRLQHIQVPFSVKLKSNKKNNISWWGQFGTYLGVALRARTDFKAGAASGEKVNIYSKINPINSGLLLGAGGEYSLDERTDLFFGAGLENGFVDVTRNKDWDDGKINLNRWAIRLGIFF